MIFESNLRSGVILGNYCPKMDTVRTTESQCGTKLTPKSLRSLNLAKAGLNSVVHGRLPANFKMNCLNYKTEV